MTIIKTIGQTKVIVNSGVVWEFVSSSPATYEFIFIKDGENVSCFFKFTSGTANGVNVFRAGDVVPVGYRPFFESWGTFSNSGVGTTDIVDVRIRTTGDIDFYDNLSGNAPGNGDTFLTAGSGSSYSVLHWKTT
jgi:hypothetical protein